MNILKFLFSKEKNNQTQFIVARSEEYEETKESVVRPSVPDVLAPAYQLSIVVPYQYQHVTACHCRMPEHVQQTMQWFMQKGRVLKCSADIRNNQLAYHYAVGLMQIILEMNGGKFTGPAREGIEYLYEKYPTETAAAYSQALAINAAHDISTLPRLEEVYHKHNNDCTVGLWYVRGMRVLAKQQPNINISQAVYGCYGLFPEDTTIAYEIADYLYDAISRSDNESFTLSLLEMLETVALAHAEHTEISDYLTDALYSIQYRSESNSTEVAARAFREHPDKCTALSLIEEMKKEIINIPREYPYLKLSKAKELRPLLKIIAESKCKSTLTAAYKIAVDTLNHVKDNTNYSIILSSVSNEVSKVTNIIKH